MNDNVEADDAWLGQMILSEQRRRKKEEKRLRKDAIRSSEQRLRKKYPAIKDAWDQYKMLIKLHQDVK